LRIQAPCFQGPKTGFSSCGGLFGFSADFFGATGQKGEIVVSTRDAKFKFPAISHEKSLSDSPLAAMKAK
jgi:hypothetical protein